MSTWYYYNEQGEKIETTGGRLKGLAKAGMITPETIVENEEGKKAPARKVKGLTFATAATPESAPLVDMESYGIAQPVPVHEPPVEVNPFAVATPEEVNPFATAAPPAAKPMEVNPFAVSTPMAKQEVPRQVTTPVAEEYEDFTETSTHRFKPIHLFAGIGALLLVLVLVGIGVSYSGSSRNSLTTAEQAEIEKYFAEHGKDALLHYTYQKTRNVSDRDALKILQYFVSKGANVNAKDERGHTSLHNVAGEGHLECVKFLVSKGADVNAKAGYTFFNFATGSTDYVRQTPLEYAKTCEGAESVVKYLTSITDERSVDNMTGGGNTKDTPINLFKRPASATKNDITHRQIAEGFERAFDPDIEQRYQGEMRVSEIERKSQARQARIRADAEIEMMRQEHQRRIISNTYTMTSTELDGLRRLLDLELQQFKSRKSMEILTTYGSTGEP